MAGEGLILPLHIRKQLGATKRFPKGKLGEHDEGELALAIGIVQNNVVLDFGKAIRSLAMPPDQTREFAQLLINKAQEIENALSENGAEPGQSAAAINEVSCADSDLGDIVGDVVGSD